MRKRLRRYGSKQQHATASMQRGSEGAPKRRCHAVPGWALKKVAAILAHWHSGCPAASVPPSKASTTIVFLKLSALFRLRPPTGGLPGRGLWRCSRRGSPNCLWDAGWSAPAPKEPRCSAEQAWLALLALAGSPGPGPAPSPRVARHRRLRSPPPTLLTRQRRALLILGPKADCWPRVLLEDLAEDLVQDVKL